jgi:hypothetical protein
LCGISKDNTITESSSNLVSPIKQHFEVQINDNNVLTHGIYDLEIVITSKWLVDDIWPNPAVPNPSWSDYKPMFEDLRFESDAEEIMPEGKWLYYDDGNFESQLSPATIPLPNMGNGNMAVFWTRFTKPTEWQEYNMVIKKVMIFNKSGVNLDLNIVAIPGSVFHHGYYFPTLEDDYGSWSHIYSGKVMENNSWIEVETDKEIKTEDFFVGVEHVELFTFLIGIDKKGQSSSRSGITTYTANWNLFMGTYNDAEYGIRVYVDPIGECE